MFCTELANEHEKSVFLVCTGGRGSDPELNRIEGDDRGGFRGVHIPECCLARKAPQGAYVILTSTAGGCATARYRCNEPGQARRQVAAGRFCSQPWRGRPGGPRGQ